MMLVDLLAVLALVVLNGWFVTAEMAIVASRRSRLQALAERGAKGAAVALGLSQDTGRFLSAVQTGITLVATLVGAVSGATLSAPLAAQLERVPLLAPMASELAFGLVVLVTTYVSLVVGELVPKNLALAHPERIATWVAPVLTVLVRVLAPVVSVLDASTRLVLRLVGANRIAAETVTEDEVKTLVAEGTESGVFHPTEREMVTRVLRFADRSVRSIMTPRGDVAWLDMTQPPEALARAALEQGHTRYPVGNGSLEEVLGILDLRDLLALSLEGTLAALRERIHPVPVVYEGTEVARVLDILREAASPMAVVVDEYGVFEGLVTDSDLFAAVVGALPQSLAPEDQAAVQRADGSWLLDGLLSTEDAKIRLGLETLAGEDEIETLGGFVLTALGRVPREADIVSYGGWVFEVIDMDGRRVDKVLARREP